LGACAGLPVNGMVDGQALDTRVDSEVARYYVENYLAGKRTDAVLDKRIDQVYENANGDLPNRDDLKKLSDEFSVDFAALYLADKIAHVPANRRFRHDFDQEVEYVRTARSDGELKLPSAAANYEIMFVPTYLYKRITMTGADMSVPRAALEKAGFPCTFVETQDDGGIEANANVVVAAIRARAHSGRRLIIVSASKSGPEVALALTRMKPAHVAAWINTVGALQGTPLIDDHVLPEIEFIVGKVDPAGPESLTAARSRPRFQSFHVPKHIFVVNYFGIPTIGSISFLASRGYFPLRKKYGPNDGLVLLPDMIFPGGITLVQLGSDHIKLNDHIEVNSVALAITVVEWVETRTIHCRPHRRIPLWTGRGEMRFLHNNLVKAPNGSDDLVRQNGRNFSEQLTSDELVSGLLDDERYIGSLTQARSADDQTVVLHDHGRSVFGGDADRFGQLPRTRHNKWNARNLADACGLRRDR